MTMASGSTTSSSNADSMLSNQDDKTDKPSVLPKISHCAYCLKEFTGKSTCGRCHRRAYCSQECQRKDWSPKGDGQGHKIWCQMEYGEEDIDWKVVPIPGKGLGVVALRDLPPKYRIMIDRGLLKSEAMARPEVMDLCPESGDFNKKFQINELASDVGQIVCLRLSRVNHACVPNAAHWYDDDYRVKILFSEKAIKAGEEISYSYISHRSIQYNYRQEVIAANLQLSWGITCPEECACKDPQTWAKVSQAKMLNNRLSSVFQSMDFNRLFPTAKMLLQLYDELEVGLLARKILYAETFQFAIMKSATVDEGLKLLREAYEIETCIEPFKKDSPTKKWLAEPYAHENYLFLENRRHPSFDASFGSAFDKLFL